MVGQSHVNTSWRELKRVLILAGDFVDIMRHRGNYMDRAVVSPPVYRHTFIGYTSPNARLMARL
jgi:hypothetical protein